MPAAALHACRIFYFFLLSVHQCCNPVPPFILRFLLFSPSFFVDGIRANGILAWRRASFPPFIHKLYHSILEFFFASNGYRESLGRWKETSRGRLEGKYLMKSEEDRMSSIGGCRRCQVTRLRVRIARSGANIFSVKSRQYNRWSSVR